MSEQKTDLAALIAELEATTKGSRGSDCLLAVHPSTPQYKDVKKGADIRILLKPRAVGITGFNSEHTNPDDEVYQYLPETNADHFDIPHFTTSLDAALELVPKGWVWHIQIDYELPGRCHLYNAVPGGPNDPPVKVQADGATPALAVCIAALIARSV